MLKNARIEEEGRNHRRLGLARAGCPYAGLAAIDWLRGYEEENLLHKAVIEPLYQPPKGVARRPPTPPTGFVSLDQYSRLQLQAKQLALAVLDLPATGSHAKLKQLARTLLDSGTSADDEASWAAVAARLQPYLRK